MKKFRLPSDDLEYDILARLWEVGVGSVRELHEHLGGRDGLVYERDLGPDTAKVAASIQEYNPTDDWLEVE